MNNMNMLDMFLLAVCIHTRYHVQTHPCPPAQAGQQPPPHPLSPHVESSFLITRIPLSGINRQGHELHYAIPPLHIRCCHCILAEWQATTSTFCKMRQLAQGEKLLSQVVAQPYA